MATDEGRPSSDGLLRANLRDPFLFRRPEHPDHVTRWFRLLSERFPFACFNADRYWRLNDSDLPTTYPLAGMVESILRDEELSLDRQQSLDPLPATLDRRRMSLAQGGVPQTHDYLLAPEVWGLDASRSLSPGYTQFLPRWISAAGYQVAWGDEGPEGSYSPYDEIGEQLVTLIEGLARAPTKAARKEAKKNLDAFIKTLAARLNAGRPTSGAPKRIAKPLITEAKQLFALLWNALPADPSDETRGILASEGIDDAEEQAAWAWRLSLPMLSRPEIMSLRSESEAGRTWGKHGERPTPRRFAVWVLARRLGIEANSLARKVEGTAASHYFRGRPNPVDTCAS